jgi:hypothetical protein
VVSAMGFGVDCAMSDGNGDDGLATRVQGGR